MTISTKTTIKTFFETGDFPTQQNFSDFVDSCVFTAETTAQAVNGDLNIGGAFSVSGKSILAAALLTTVSATSLYGTLNGNVTGNLTGNVTGNVTATTVSAATVSPTNITGTATNDNAAAGSIGELISSNISSGAAVSLSTGVAKNITSISLAAGDWDVWGGIGFIPAGSTAISLYAGGINTATGTLPTFPAGGAAFLMAAPWTAGISQGFNCGMTRISVAATTTVFLVAQANFSVSTMTAYGFIGARRRR